MSNSSSQYKGAKFKRLIQRGLITIRADLKNPKVLASIAKAFSVECPNIRQINTKGDRELAWMSTDELMGFISKDQINQVIEKIKNALSGQHSVVLDVSDTRSEFELLGPIRDVLAKGTPSDVSREGLIVGEFRRSRMGQIQIAFWLRDENEARIFCRSSEASYLENWLKSASILENATNFFHS